MAFHLYTGNKLENLAEVFCRNSFPPGTGNIFAPKIAVVGSQGMAAFIAQHIGGKAHRGIVFQLQTPFLTNFIDEILKLWFSPELAREFNHQCQLFDRTTRTLEIATLIRRYPQSFPYYINYLKNDPGQVRLFQLADRLQDLLDRCAFYRQEFFAPDIPAAALGDPQLSNLLQLLNQTGFHSRITYLQKMLTLPPAQPQQLPARMAAFALTSLPGVGLDFFARLAEYCEVDFYTLSPCQSFWAELRSRREQQKAIDRGDADESTFAEDHPLLAELGSSGRDFLNLLLDRNLYTGEEQELFEPPATSDPPLLLQQFQNDLLNNFNRTAENQFTKAPDDDSITIHSCYNPRREVEQLHEELLRILSDNAIAPRDILVVAPDITSFAPLIDAVFSQGPLRDCFTICDRPLRAVSPAAELFELLLKLHHQRAEATELLALLGYPVLRERFDISEADRPIINELVAEAGIMWGENGQERAQKCGVEFSEYSWQQGLDRLMLGVAIENIEPTADTQLYPAGNAEGSRAELLGKLAEFCRKIFQLRHALPQARTLEQWRNFVDDMLKELFSPSPQYAAELNALRQVMHQLADRAKCIGFAEKIPVEALVELLAPGLLAPAGKQHFLRDKITFCSFLPMRSVPVQVVALLGMSDGKFPRRDRHDAFSLPGPRRLGDPSPAHEDRYMLLETLISARLKLLFFYTGHNLDGSELAPCMPLAEIAEYLNQGYQTTIFKHSRQAYDPENFMRSVPDRRSFSSQALHTAQNFLTATKRPAQAGLLAPLPELTDAVAVLDKKELVATLTNPCAQLLKTRCNLQLEQPELPEENDVEPLALSPLQKVLLRQEIWQLKLQNYPQKHQLKVLQLSNRLPVGKLGEQCFDELAQQIAQVPAQYLDYGQRRTRLWFDFYLAQTHFTGSSWGCADGTEQYAINFSAPHKSRLVDFYVAHLMQTVQFKDQQVISHGLFMDSQGKITRFELPPLESAAAEEKLNFLRELYWQSLNCPLPLFPQSSLAYVQADPDRREKAAFQAFVSNSHHNGDASDPAISYFFDAQNFYSPKFVELASQIYSPILQGVLS